MATYLLMMTSRIRFLEVLTMTSAERKAVRARKEDLMRQGVDEVLAGVMAKAELDACLIVPVVNFDDESIDADSLGSLLVALQKQEEFEQELFELTREEMIDDFKKTMPGYRAEVARKGGN